MVSSSPERLGEWIEILRPLPRPSRVRHVLFDFDGTLSLIREGWQNVMIPLMLEALEPVRGAENPENLRLSVMEYVTRLTGRQTIYQMIELADQIRRRGGTPLDPLEYKHEYLRRLETRIEGRVKGLGDGTVDPAALLVPGSIPFLDGLRERGCRLYLASGTDEPFVLREAKLLGLERYFDGGIYGALDNYKNFSKQMVIDRILKENNLKGSELLAIGDGYVEIENTKGVGGLALGLPTLEPNPYDYDAWKKDRLVQAGADVLAPNFLEHDLLLDYLFAA